jgi:hypothetical protein
MLSRFPEFARIARDPWLEASKETAKQRIFLMRDLAAIEMAMSPGAQDTRMRWKTF